MPGKQQHTSACTSLNQVAAGIKFAVSQGLIRPGTVAVDVGGGRYDAGKHYAEAAGAVFHVYDPFNRDHQHNEAVKVRCQFRSQYVGLHNVLNVIKEDHIRKAALQTALSFMAPMGSVVHITVYEGDRSGQGRESQPDRGKGSCWQENRKTSDYLEEIRYTFNLEHFKVYLKGKNILIETL